MRYKILLILISLCIIASAMLAFEQQPAFCTTESGCSVVTSSIYATTFGIKNSFIGLIIFIILVAIIYSHHQHPTHEKKQIIRGMITIGSLIALYFLYLQHYVLNAYCTYCIIVDTTLIIAAVLIWFDN